MSLDNEYKLEGDKQEVKTVEGQPTGQELAQEVAPIIEIAQSYVIDCPEVFELASAELLSIKAKKKELENRRKSITVPMDAAKKSVMDLFSTPIEALDKAEAVLKTTILNYTVEQRRIAEEAQRKANAEAEVARKRMEEEARKLREDAEKAEREAEEARIAAQKTKDDAEKALAQAASNPLDAQAQANAVAAQVTAQNAIATAQATSAAAESKAGNIETACAMQTASTMVVAAPVQSAKKVKGISTTVRWSAEVTDKMAYLKHVIDNVELIDTVLLDMKALNQMAVALKAGMKYPGIKAVSTESVSARA